MAVPGLLSIDQCIAENIPLSAGYRDFEGYKGQYPDPKWPGQAKLCVNFVLNYEEGGEHNLLNGDLHSETMLQEVSRSQPGRAVHRIDARADDGRAPTRVGGRDIQMETQYEYGTRAGVWRLGRLFKDKGIRVTVYAVGQAILKSPDAAASLVAAGHEFASHGYRWIDHHALPLAVEKEQIEKNMAAITRIAGQPPRGWYYGRPSTSSRALVCHVYQSQGLELLYQCDSYADELPYWTPHPLEAGKGLLMIPYTYDVNDMKYTTSPGFADSTGWLNYAKAAFDVMYEEGCKGEPKMMTVGLHNRIAGKPARFKALRDLVEYMQGHEGVWFATREEIARHWIKEHPFDAAKLNKLDHFI